MAQIATKDEYVVDADGIRRKISKGAPIPAHLAAAAGVKTETVDTRSLARPVVDEEASLSQAERTKASRRTSKDS